MQRDEAVAVEEGQAAEAEAAAAEQAEAESEQQQYEADELKAEVEAVDIGKLGDGDEQKAIVLRYLRRRSQLAAEITFIKDQTAALIKSLESKMNGLDYVYRGQAEDYCRKNLKGKARSIKTTFGQIGFRATPGGLTITDESKLLNAAMMAPEGSPLQDLYELVPKLKKSAVNAMLKDGGELPPFCEVKDSEDKFYVK